MDFISTAELLELIGIFGLAFFYFWPSIPAGLALGLPAPLVIAASSLSYACGAAVVALAGGPLRRRVLRRINRPSTLNPDSLIGRIWSRFGLIGLGLAAPMTIGSQAGAALGVALDSPPRLVFIWLAMGGLLWSILLTLGVVLLGLGR